MTVISWNIEGARRGAQALSHLSSLQPTALVFLSEPQLFLCDASLALSSMSNFSFHLNSEDSFLPSMAMDHRRAWGGTLALWHSSLDPFVTVLPTTSSAVLPIFLSIPGLSPSIHIGIYLPTSGRDPDFLTAITALDMVLVTMVETRPGVPVYIRGDANVNPNNTARYNLFQHFLTKHSLTSLPLLHNTHHHFTGGGASDAQLDVLLYAGPPALAESLSSITCGLENPLISSHHDLVTSSFPSMVIPATTTPQATTAPRVPNTRVRVRWDAEGLENYQSLLSTTLPFLQDTLTCPSSSALASILIDSTNTALRRAAELSFSTVKLSSAPKTRANHNPEVAAAQRAALLEHRGLRALLSSPLSSPAAVTAARASSSAATSTLRATVRRSNQEEASKRDNLLHSVLSSDPTRLFKAVRSSQRSGDPALHQLQVGDRTYTGEAVPDGFFDALSALKVPDPATLTSNPSYLTARENYRHILEICKAGPSIPAISPTEAQKLLERLRPDVIDFYSISAHHYLAAGLPGIQHFTLLLNLLISDINSVAIPEVNSAWAIMLHKGHGKPRSSSRSWRCISTCPLLAKALDLRVADLQRENWSNAAPSTQFMARGSSHELAALLLTETTLYANRSLGIPLYVLLLDKQAAFDSVLKEHVLSAAFSAAGNHGDQSLLYMATRLASRLTYVEQGKVIMGPIHDTAGVEQGGVSSSDQFQLVNGEELDMCNDSGLGLDMGAVSVAAIGQADDVALVSPHPAALQSLLNLSEAFSSSTSLTNVPEKTKLLVYPPSKGDGSSITYWQEATPIMMSGAPLPLSSQAEHVGVVRSTCGTNMPALLSRLSAHGRSLYGTIHCGMARSHRGNPAASLRVEALYCAPRLYSGLATLLLSPTEVSSLHSHQKVTLERLQRLYPRTPASAVYFLSGTLPAPAILHMRQFSLLFMIARLGQNNILWRHGTYILHHSIRHSWYSQVRELTLQYSLPDPLLTLTSPPTSKQAWKGTVRRAVTAYWHSMLVAEAQALPSLIFLRPSFIPLGRGAHPLWTTCGSSPTAVRAATVQARMLSGRYRTDWLRRHWTGESGACRLPTCSSPRGDLPHLLSGTCPALAQTLAGTLHYWRACLSNLLHLLPPVLTALQATPERLTTFILDPSTDPGVISLVQLHGTNILYTYFLLSRSWIWAVHRRRLQLLDLHRYLL